MRSGIPVLIVLALALVISAPAAYASQTGWQGSPPSEEDPCKRVISSTGIVWDKIVACVRSLVEPRPPVTPHAQGKA